MSHLSKAGSYDIWGVSAWGGSEGRRIVGGSRDECWQLKVGRLLQAAGKWLTSHLDEKNEKKNQGSESWHDLAWFSLVSIKYHLFCTRRRGTHEAFRK